MSARVELLEHGSLPKPEGKAVRVEDRREKVAAQPPRGRVMAHQIAVFAENKPGRIERVSRILGEAGVNIRAITVATADAFGIIKLLVDDPEKAYAALAAGGVSVFKREIVAVVMDDRPGGLLAATQALSKAGINIEDAYGFVIEDKRRAVLVVEVEKIPEAIDVLREQGIRTLSDDEIYTL